MKTIRICVVGFKGEGKSSFLNTLFKILQPNSQINNNYTLQKKLGIFKKNENEEFLIDSLNWNINLNFDNLNENLEGLKKNPNNNVNIFLILFSLQNYLNFDLINSIEKKISNVFKNIIKPIFIFTNKDKIKILEKKEDEPFVFINKYEEKINEIQKELNTKTNCFFIKNHNCDKDNWKKDIEQETEKTIKFILEKIVNEYKKGIENEIFK
jgi:energy-coupling factor transporter ATP-binding protein EcfA2